MTDKYELKKGDWVLYQGERYQIVETRRETLLFFMVLLGKPGEVADLWVHAYDVELDGNQGVQS